MPQRRRARAPLLLLLLVALAALSALLAAAPHARRRRALAPPRPLPGAGRSALPDAGQPARGGEVTAGSQSPSPSPDTQDFLTALQLYHSKLNATVSDVIEQSSNRFKDFHEPKGVPGVPVPSDSAQRSTDDSWRYCDPTNTDYNDTSDAMCVQYMSNVHNMAAIRPMFSILSVARTIKYRIRFHHGGLQAILKVSQKKFLQEPQAELAAWWVDRILGVRRVPPTAWVSVPVDWLRAAASLMDDFYCQWVEAFVFRYPPIVPWLKRREGQWWMNVSVQLWMADVHMAQDTVLAVPSYWESFFDPAARHRRWPPAAIFNHSLVEISLLVVFDYVVVNQDRHLTRNNYAVGGCTGRKCPAVPPDQRHRGPPALIFLDQGSSFYTGWGNPHSPLVDVDRQGRPRNVTFCRVAAALYQRMKELRGPPEGKQYGEQTLWGQLQRHLPPVVVRYIRPALLIAAQRRMDYVLHHVESTCLRRFPRTDVLMASPLA